jgi:hypothetical protein
MIARATNFDDRRLIDLFRDGGLAFGFLFGLC